MNSAQDTIAKSLKLSRAISMIDVGAGSLGNTGRHFKSAFPGQCACLIADENTWVAAGARLQELLLADGITARSHILPALPKPKPSVELASQLMGVLDQPDEIAIAVGSGVINDIVKYAAFKLCRPYVCVATAVSMDGYTSAGAPLSEKGFKKTIQCQPAKIIIADLDVLAAAPRKMSSWGYSDLAGKIPAGADWIVADRLGVEAIEQTAWNLVQKNLRQFLSRPTSVAAGSTAALEELFAGLAVVGIAMELHGSSRPASGADHQIAHLWEMQGLSRGGELVSHGACVAIGSIATLQLYDWLLRQDFADLDIENTVRAAKSFDQKVEDAKSAFGSSELFERSVEEMRRKHTERGVLLDRLDKLKSNWSQLGHELEAQLFTVQEFSAKLKLAGAPYTPEMIGVSRQRLHETVLHARFLRSRYTILDLLEEAGFLNRAVDDLFGVSTGQHIV